MRTILGWGCATLAGSAGWWLGAKLNMVGAVVLGALSTAVGLYYGRRWFDEHLG